MHFLSHQRCRFEQLEEWEHQQLEGGGGAPDSGDGFSFLSTCSLRYLGHIRMKNQAGHWTCKDGMQSLGISR